MEFFFALNPRPCTCYEFLNHIFTSFRNLTTEQRYNKQFGKNFTKETKRRTWVLTICQKISEIPTEHKGVRFEVVCSFRLVRTKRNVAYHLPISRFLLGSRLILHKFTPFWVQTVTDVAILQ